MFIPWFCSYSLFAFVGSKYVSFLRFLVFCQIMVLWTFVSLCEIKLWKMLYPLQCVACLCLSTLIFESCNVDSSPVIIPDVTIIKPRLPENICFNEALDEGGKWRMIYQNQGSICRGSKFRFRFKLKLFSVYLQCWFQDMPSSSRIVILCADLQHLQNKYTDLSDQICRYMSWKYMQGISI